MKIVIIIDMILVVFDFEEMHDNNYDGISTSTRMEKNEK